MPGGASLEAGEYVRRRAAHLGGQRSRRGLLLETRQPIDLRRAANVGTQGANRSAGDALELYYRLAENEALLDLVTRALGETRQAIDKVARLRSEGLKLPPDNDLFTRRALELTNQQVQLENGISQQNSHLWWAMGLRPAAPQERLWPTDELIVNVEPVDVEAAVQYGLSMRPELNMLRRLRGNLNADSLPAARAALRM